jgi:hypothetical protein
VIDNAGGAGYIAEINGGDSTHGIVDLSYATTCQGMTLTLSGVNIENQSSSTPFATIATVNSTNTGPSGVFVNGGVWTGRINGGAVTLAGDFKGVHALGITGSTTAFSDTTIFSSGEYQDILSLNALSPTAGGSPGFGGFIGGSTITGHNWNPQTIAAQPTNTYNGAFRVCSTTNDNGVCYTNSGSHYSSLNLMSPIALPNGSTAMTKSAGDNSTKLATTAYADGAAATAESNAETYVRSVNTTGPAGADGVVQSIAVGTVGNTASAVSGTLTVGGTAANPTISINFPASSGGGGTPTISAWDSGTTYSVGQLVTYNSNLYIASLSSTNETPGSSTGAAYWSGVTNGSGAHPSGIPYAVAYHNGPTSSPDYFGLVGVAAGGLGPSESAILPTACTPSATWWTWNPNISSGHTLTFAIYAVSTTTTSSPSDWSTTGSAITSCIMNTAATASTPATCTASGSSSPVAAGTVLTIKVTGDSTNLSGTSTYTVMQGFSCQ